MLCILLESLKLRIICQNISNMCLSTKIRPNALKRPHRLPNMYLNLTKEAALGN